MYDTHGSRSFINWGLLLYKGVSDQLLIAARDSYWIAGELRLAMYPKFPGTHECHEVFGSKILLFLSMSYIA